MSTINTTQLSKHFGFSVPAKLLIKLDIEPASKAKAGYNWHLESVPAIGAALGDYVRQRGATAVDIESVTAKPETPGKATESPASFDDDDEL